MDTCRHCGYHIRLYLFLDNKRVVSANNEIAMLVVAVAGGVGCSLACFINEKMSKDKTYVNVIMSDDLEEMKRLRDFLAQHHITNVASDSYTLDWNAKTISIIVYPETKAESRLINEFIADSSTKFKRVIQPSLGRRFDVADIKIRDTVKGTIKALDKATIA